MKNKKVFFTLDTKDQRNGQDQNKFKNNENTICIGYGGGTKHRCEIMKTGELQTWKIKERIFSEVNTVFKVKNLNLSKIKEKKTGCILYYSQREDIESKIEHSIGLV